MPLHDFRCPNGHTFDAYVAQGVHERPCEFCRDTAVKIFLKAPAGFVQRDICYDSPIDGRPITNKFARAEDLRRSDSVPYEPGMKQDAERRRLESDQALDKAVDSTVDEFFATAPLRKKEQLSQELHAGASAEVTRVSPATT